jgi:DNA-binding CsgD family transcriptional regulator
VDEAPESEPDALDPLDEVVDGFGRAVRHAGTVPGDDLVVPSAQGSAQAADLGRVVRVGHVAAGEPLPTGSGTNPRPTEMSQQLSRNLRRYALTRREYDILRHISMGETNPEIALALGLTRNTVKTYVQSALTKLGARNRIEALNRLNELGLL